MFLRPNLRLTRRIPFNLICAALIFLAASKAINADELAIWNFNDSDLNVDHGSGTLMSNINVANILFAAGTTTNARQGDTAGQALSLQGGTGNANNGRNITFAVSTVGFANIVVSFATQGTSTGFNSNQFQYSLDGISFVDFSPPYTPATTFGAVPFVFSLAAIVGLTTIRTLCSGLCSMVLRRRRETIASTTLWLRERVPRGRRFRNQRARCC